MKKLLFILASIFSGWLVFAAEYQPERTASVPLGADSVEYNSLVSEISGPEAPRVSGRYAVFTAPGNVRHTGIAFEHENYKKIHNFNRLILRDEFGEPLRNSDGTYADTTLFFILKIPQETKEIRYRIVRDGIWTADPYNSRSEYDITTGTQVSVLPVEYYKVYETSSEEKKYVHFIYQGKSGETIRLAGSFNNWDPFMYEMKEVARGKYELKLPLPKGTWYYAFFQGMTQIHDTSATEKVYTRDGRVASVVTVQ